MGWTVKEDLERLHFYVVCMRRYGIDFDSLSKWQRARLDYLRREVDGYMGFHFYPEPLPFSDVCVDIQPNYALPYYPALLDYIEKYGDLRLKSWYMQYAPVREDSPDDLL